MGGYSSELYDGARKGGFRGQKLFSDTYGALMKVVNEQTMENIALFIWYWAPVELNTEGGTTATKLVKTS